MPARARNRADWIPLNGEWDFVVDEVNPNAHLRWHSLRGEWVAYAGHLGGARSA